MFCFYFVFQAEDGIRDLVRSRGLGDVYKRQVNTFEIVTSAGNDFDHEVVRVCKKMPKWVPAIQNLSLIHI